MTDNIETFFKASDNIAAFKASRKGARRTPAVDSPCTTVLETRHNQHSDADVYRNRRPACAWDSVTNALEPNATKQRKVKGKRKPDRRAKPVGRRRGRRTAIQRQRESAQ